MLGYRNIHVLKKVLNMKYIQIIMLNSKEQNVLCKFRCSGLNFMIEKGRHLNIDRSLRLCQF